jgi:hypothetical protein
MQSHYRRNYEHDEILYVLFRSLVRMMFTHLPEHRYPKQLHHTSKRLNPQTRRAMHLEQRNREVGHRHRIPILGPRKVQVCVPFFSLPPSLTALEVDQSPNAAQVEKPKRLITLLIEDMRSGETDLQLAEVKVPLRPAPLAEDGFWADALDVAQELQSSPSRIDGMPLVWSHVCFAQCHSSPIQGQQRSTPFEANTAKYFYV